MNSRRLRERAKGAIHVVKIFRVFTFNYVWEDSFFFYIFRYFGLLHTKWSQTNSRATICWWPFVRVENLICLIKCLKTGQQLFTIYGWGGWRSHPRLSPLRKVSSKEEKQFRQKIKKKHDAWTLFFWDLILNSSKVENKLRSNGIFSMKKAEHRWKKSDFLPKIL